MATRGSYVHISMGIILGGIPINNCFITFMQFSTKIDGFEQKDSQGFENSYNSYEQYPLEKFFIFTIYQNYTWALSFKCKILAQILMMYEGALRSSTKLNDTK